MSVNFNRESLQALKKQNLPHCTATDIFEIEGSTETADVAQRLNEYFSHFLAPKDGKCVCCGALQGASNVLEALVTARFRWALQHGEGFCSDCGYPARAMHYIGKGDEEIRITNFILQYHPDELSFDRKPENELEPA